MDLSERRSQNRRRYWLVLSAVFLVTFSLPSALPHLAALQSTLNERISLLWPADKGSNPYSRQVGASVPHGRGFSAIQICSGGSRATRQATCLVDGDTGWEQGVKWRFYDIDTPEIGKPQCVAEYAKAIASRDRLRQLMSGGYRIEQLGQRGNYGRELVRVILADGRDAAQVLLDEGLAQPWPNTGNVWCGR